MTLPDAAPDPGDVRWLSDLEMRAWRTFVETRADLMTALERDLSAAGLTLGDYQVFVTLSEHADDAMRMCDLAQVLQLSPSGLTRRLDSLVRAGYVERRSSLSDRRVMLAVLTEAGRERLELAAPVHVASVRARILDLLDDDELEAMASIFGKIRAGLDGRTDA